MVKIAEAASEASVSALFSRWQMSTRAYVAETNQHFSVDSLFKQLRVSRAMLPIPGGLSTSFDYLVLELDQYRTEYHKYYRSTIE